MQLPRSCCTCARRARATGLLRLQARGSYKRISSTLSSAFSSSSSLSSSSLPTSPFPQRRLKMDWRRRKRQVVVVQRRQGGLRERAACTGLASGARAVCDGESLPQLLLRQHTERYTERQFVGDSHMPSRRRRANRRQAWKEEEVAPESSGRRRRREGGKGMGKQRDLVCRTRALPHLSQAAAGSSAGRGPVSALSTQASAAPQRPLRQPGRALQRLRRVVRACMGGGLTWRRQRCCR